MSYRDTNTNPWRFQERPLASADINENFRIIDEDMFVVNEVPSGTINGINDAFITINLFRTGTTAIYLKNPLFDGLVRQIINTDYTETVTGINANKEIVFTTAPLALAIIVADYHRKDI